jgi:hypothetical protein
MCDLDGDGACSVADLATLLARWGVCEADEPCDLDSDGVVGAADLSLLLDAMDLSEGAS